MGMFLLNCTLNPNPAFINKPPGTSKEADRAKNSESHFTPRTEVTNFGKSILDKSSEETQSFENSPSTSSGFVVRSVPLKDEDGKGLPRLSPKSNREWGPSDSRLPLKRPSDQGLEQYISAGVHSIRVDRQESCLYSIVLERRDDVVVTKRMNHLKRGYDEGSDDLTISENRLSKSGSAAHSVCSDQSLNSTSKKERNSGGFFSFFKWFKKEKSEEDENSEDLSAPSSPVLLRANRSVCGSVDTLFSTATASSFAYVPPSYYRPYGSARKPDTRIAQGPETSTYRNRLLQSERSRKRDQNISLKEKYNLYASGTIRRSVDHIHEIDYDDRFENAITHGGQISVSRNSTLGRKKRKAPPPPTQLQTQPSCSDLSLPCSLEHNSKENKHRNEPSFKNHRRTLSESAKYKVGCHVKGKRRAPPPPEEIPSNKGTDVSAIVTSEKSKNSLKKKRPAPPPPIVSTSGNQETVSPIVDIITEAAVQIINEREKDEAIEAKEETVSNASTVDIEQVEVAATDTLRLERGVLKPNKMDQTTLSEPKIASPSSPVSPRPWYKRSVAHKEHASSSGSKRKDRERKIDDWMLESGFPRRNIFPSTDSSTGAKYNVFAKLDRPEEKRKSQISILTNISELDREAAEIVQKDKARERALLASHEAKYYSHFEESVNNGTAEMSEPPKKSSTRELISLFNAITNVTKVTVNSSFFSRENSNIFRRELGPPYLGREREKQITLNETNIGAYKPGVEVVECGAVGTNSPFGYEEPDSSEKSPIVTSPESQEPPNLVGRSYNGNDKKITRVTIEELDEYDAESPSATKSQTMYEANRHQRHQLPTIPTIVEVSERTSPASTAESLNLLPESTEAYKRVMSWVCPRCTLENSRWKLSCEACDMWKPSSTEVKPSSVLAVPSTSKSSVTETLTKGTESNAQPDLKGARTEKKPQSSHQTRGSSSSDSNITVIINEQLSDRNSKEIIDVDKNIKNEIKENEQTEALRKARLAYFSKGGGKSERLTPKINSETSTDNSAKNKEPIITKDMDPDRQRLREMLKDLKHSLPKQPKSSVSQLDPGEKIKKSDTDNRESEGKKEIKRSNAFKKDEETSGAIKKVIKKEPLREKNSYVVGTSGDTAEIYLVESETRIEEIKYKKPSEKVSSSAQTNTTVRQVTPAGPPQTDKPKEIVVPITVEQHVIKDGKIETTISRGAKRIGTRTFELMRPRDFANIEAIKTGGKPEPAHFYANIPDSDKLESLPSTSQQASDEAFNTDKKKFAAAINSSSNFPKLGGEDLKVSTAARDVNTLAVNRLLKKLEVAIANGQHDLAAGLAKDLARLKINCSVTRQKPESISGEILVDMYVEDKVSHQGPIPLRVTPDMTVSQLKNKLEKEYEIPIGVQRWILGKQLTTDDNATLDQLGVNTPGIPVFLYLVAPDAVKDPTVTNLSNPIATAPLPIVEEVEEEADINVDIQKAKEPSCVNGELAQAERPTMKEEIIIEIKSSQSSQLNPQPSTSSDQTPLVPPPTGTMALGWKCAVCTLVNSPTRPGCAACTTERPGEYKVPSQYNVNESEIARIDREKKLEQEAARAEEENKLQNYQKLMDLEKNEVVICADAFECPVCLVECPPMEGVVLHECLHTFCKTCLSNTVEYSEEAEVKCPFRDDNYSCNSTMLEREIKALVSPEIYEQHLAKSITQAETKIENAFHCKTPDCKGWCIYEDNVNLFQCPVCTHLNCLTCQAIHEGLDCKQFQEQLNKESPNNVEAKRTKEMLKEMVDRGEAMACPTCQVVLMKKWGCDWLRCSMCKTEICWVTRGPRWGPNGKGDTSGGCQCGVNGVKCHPKCNYCH